jgi:hypothetical protein
MSFPRLIIALLLSISASAGERPKPPAKAPALLELSDQFDTPRRLSFPSTNVVLLTIADRKGSGQIDGWVAALKARYDGRVEIHGLADVRGVPVPWRGKVRKKFQETRRHPVMLDWSGTNCAQFGSQPGVANVLFLARDGTIRCLQRGPVQPAALQEMFETIDAVFAGTAAPLANEPATSTVSARP